MSPPVPRAVAHADSTADARTAKAHPAAGRYGGRGMTDAASTPTSPTSPASPASPASPVGDVPAPVLRLEVTISEIEGRTAAFVNVGDCMVVVHESTEVAGHLYVEVEPRHDGRDGRDGLEPAQMPVVVVVADDEVFPDRRPFAGPHERFMHDLAAGHLDGRRDPG